MGLSSEDRTVDSRPVYLVHRPLDALRNFNPSGSRLPLTSLARQAWNHHAVEVVDDNRRSQDLVHVTRYNLAAVGGKRTGNDVELQIERHVDQAETKHATLYMMGDVRGKTSWSDADIEAKALRLIREHGIYNLRKNNCQKWSLALFNAICDVEGSVRARHKERVRREEWSRYSESHASSSGSVDSSSINISITTLAGEPFNIDISSLETISELKRQVIRAGIISDQQALMFAGQEQLDNDRTLGSYGIASGSVLHLVLPSHSPSVMTIVLNFQNGLILELDINSSDTVKIVKEKVHEQASLAPAQQIWVFKERVLSDNRWIVDYGVQTGSAIDVFISAPA